LTIQDPAYYTQSGFHKQRSISIWSRNGRVSVSADKYMNTVEIFKPDLYVTLCDGDTNKYSSHKRINKAVEKSKAFFERCLKRHMESNVLKNKGFLGSIEGGYNLQARENCIKYMEDKPILGYIIDGLHKNGIETQNIGIDEIKHVIEHSLVS
jgi:queuine tRNA-ribosyltransferase subunit QTRTD1